ncbi:MAG: zinc ABC transporter substrate-binding protein, partial [Actinobacteria bacterium]|nr:zinc ABC transporter substrate-binding protein [Actinomycetota bacterium]
MRQGLTLLLLAVGAVAPATACAAKPTTATTTGPVEIVAAENVWGGIAARLGGARAKTTSIVSNPDTDPHDYEPTPGDGRRVAAAHYVILNGIGYDPWADKLLRANPVNARRVLRIGDALGLHVGDNPHQWYSPAAVQKVVDRITADLAALRPADRATFDNNRDAFLSRDLAAYHAAIADINARYAGVPVG